MIIPRCPCGSRIEIAKTESGYIARCLNPYCTKSLDCHSYDENSTIEEWKEQNTDTGFYICISCNKATPYKNKYYVTPFGNECPKCNREKRVKAINESEKGNSP